MLYSWKHTGVVMAVKAGIHIKQLQIQFRHHGLDQVDQYLRDLGIQQISTNHPRLFCQNLSALIQNLYDPDRQIYRQILGWI